MNRAFYRDLRLGVLGGGQLGRMFLRAAIDYNVNVSVLDPSANAPCRKYCNNFVQGDFRDENTVYSFGKTVDVLTIEIENVNVAALRRLQQEGVQVYPQPEVIALVQDKGQQKAWYAHHNIPTADFRLVQNRAELLADPPEAFPFVAKLRTGGYDGRGVQVVQTEAQLQELFDAPMVIEAFTAIEKEISVLVARNPAGEVQVFPVVEMAFNPEANLVEYLFAPSSLPTEVQQNAQALGKQIIEELQMVGLLAVELFYTTEGTLLVNEVAPRAHNSGHHTIEANHTSQFAQLLRAVLNLPLGSTASSSPAVMVNLLGEPGYTGQPRYAGIEEVLALPGVELHLYGKAETRPYRKMGHITILADDLTTARQRAHQVKQQLKVIAD